jgi:hypothetical protein
VKYNDKLSAIKTIGLSKIDVMGITKGKGEDVS